MTAARALMDVLANKYPESLGHGFITNAPWIFGAFWRMLKPFIDPHTMSKISFVKNEKLKEYIDDESILEEFGGTGIYKREKDPLILFSTMKANKKAQNQSTEGSCFGADLS
eukprot:TRINITY_DN3784_c0_g2_i2.p1 TRINITY_DN3784_c0_g2~~TRINITY_DN3784_c0_g2_i2.p1  ORF type:complete len:112 (+),score=22.88 TRINITY_DN3784_c0_g2_i2:85-420(+)